MEGLIFDFVAEKMANFTEVRSMGPKPEGPSEKKFLSSCYTGLTNLELSEVAKLAKVSHGVIKNWRTKFEYMEQEKANVFDFTAYWKKRMVSSLHTETGRKAFDIDKLLEEYKVYSFAARVEVGHAIEDLAEAHPAFPFLNGLYWKSLTRHIFLSSMDYRRKDTKREKPESRNKTMARIEENLDRVIDYIGTYVEDSEGKSLIFDKLYFLVSNVNRLNA